MVQSEEQDKFQVRMDYGRPGKFQLATIGDGKSDKIQNNKSDVIEWGGVSG